MPIKKILVVDDSPTERHCLNEILTKAGYQVSFALNGEDGVAKAKSEQVTLIAVELAEETAQALDALLAEHRGFRAVVVQRRSERA